jgi:Arc/MetJ family transcription regulator
MSRTTVDIDDALLEQAKRATGERTTKATIKRALEEVVQKKHTRELLALKGSGIISLTPEEVEDMRSNE